MNRPIQLVSSDGTLIKELDLPLEFRNLPTVIFYGTRAFISVLPANGNYVECNCWRATEEEHLAGERSA